MSFEVVRTEIAGLPAFFAPDGGPIPSAGLTFRAGRADETAATSGVSHLVEHLILPARTGERVDFNGHIESLVTATYASGAPDDLRAFLASTAALARDLPLERLEIERKILLAEEATRSTGGVRQALALRFGPVRAGLTGYVEYGLRRLSAEDVEAWTAERFTAANAALWLTTMPPDGLELQLPAGDRRFECPEPRQIEDLRTPAVYDLANGGLCLSFVAPRTILTGVALEVAGNALLDRMRYELGLSYSVDTDTHPLSSELTHFTLWTDIADAAVPEWLEEALAVFDALAENGPSEERLEQVREARRRTDRDPASASGWVASCADWELEGFPYQTHAEYVAEREDITPGDVARMLAEIRPTLLVVGPETTPLPPGFEPYPLASSTRIDGRRHRPQSLRDRLRRDLRMTELRASPEGITSTSPTGNVVTVPFDRVVVCMQEPGERTLLTDDGFFLTINAEAWTGGKELIAQIDAAIPSELVVSDGPAAAAQSEVAQLAEETFKSTRLVSQELALLPYVLEEDEHVVALGKATRGWRLGLLALTTRRLHFIYEDGSKHSFVVERGTPVSPRAKGNELELEVDGEPIKLTDVQPRGKAEELAQLLEGWVEVAPTSS